MTRYGRDRDGRRHADEDQQRGHEETAADAEHAGNEADRETHRENEENIDGEVRDREVDFQRDLRRRVSGR